jgi:hypothetical protein
MQRSNAETLWVLGKDSSELRWSMVEWVHGYAVADAEDDRMRSEPPPWLTSAALTACAQVDTCLPGAACTPFCIRSFPGT